MLRYSNYNNLSGVALLAGTFRANRNERLNLEHESRMLQRKRGIVFAAKYDDPPGVNR